MVPSDGVQFAGFPQASVVIGGTSNNNSSNAPPPEKQKQKCCPWSSYTSHEIRFMSKFICL